MADRFHVHRMTSWTPWEYAGNNRDERSKYCQDETCSYSEEQERRHQHDRGTVSTVSGVTVRRCAGCGATL